MVIVTVIAVTAVIAVPVCAAVVVIIILVRGSRPCAARPSPGSVRCRGACSGWAQTGRLGPAHRDRDGRRRRTCRQGRLRLALVGGQEPQREIRTSGIWCGGARLGVVCGLCLRAPCEQRRDAHERARARSAENVVAVSAVVPAVRECKRRAAFTARRAGRVWHEMSQLRIWSRQRLGRVRRKQRAHNCVKTRRYCPPPPQKTYTPREIFGTDDCFARNSKHNSSRFIVPPISLTYARSTLTTNTHKKKR